METNKAAPFYKGETPENLAAFQAYLAMGEKRNHKALARQLKRPERTVNGWSKRFQWRERLNAWQEEERERALENVKKSFFKDSENLRTFKYEILDELKKKFEKMHWCAECETPKCSVSEMINILNVVKTELSEPTNITKNTNPNPENDPFAILLSRLFPKPNEGNTAN